MRDVVIASAVRTPVGNFGGSLRTIPAYDLGALVLNEVVKRARLEPAAVNMVIMGQNYQSGEYVNVARQSLLKAGWPVEVPALTLDGLSERLRRHLPGDDDDTERECGDRDCRRCRKHEHRRVLSSGRGAVGHRR